MIDDKRLYLFEKAPIHKAVLQLAIPTVLSSLVMVLYNMADTYFVGMLNDPVQTAAVTLAAPVLLAFNAINNLFGVGTSSMMSRALGNKAYDTVEKSAVFGFYSSIFSGILFALLCTVGKTPLLALLGADAVTAEATNAYMFWTVTCGATPAILNVVMAYMVRSEGASLHASVGTMSGCILNMILDPVFILPWGLNMGAAGAGLATFLSNCVACLYFFVLLRVRRNNTFISLDPRKFTLRRDIVRGVCGVGIPASIQNLLNVTGMTILTNFTSAYGADAVAAMGIAYKINMIPMQINFGFSQGIMPLVSYTYAGENYKRMKKGILFTIRSILPLMVLVAIGSFVCADGLVRAFMDNDTIVSYGASFLRGYNLGMPFLCLDFMAVGVFQAIGKGKYAFIFAILRKIILEIPALFILNALFPLYGLFYAQFVAELILATAAAIMLMKIFKLANENQT